MCRLKPSDCSGSSAVWMLTQYLFIELVLRRENSRDAATMIPVTQCNIVLGSHIRSDEWPDVHTNSIESIDMFS